MPLRGEPAQRGRRRIGIPRPIAGTGTPYQYVGDYYKHRYEMYGDNADKIKYYEAIAIDPRSAPVNEIKYRRFPPRIFTLERRAKTQDDIDEELKVKEQIQKDMQKHERRMKQEEENSKYLTGGKLGGFLKSHKVHPKIIEKLHKSGLLEKLASVLKKHQKK